jgi:hypothetical protein
MLTHHNIHKFTWTFPDGKTHHQIDHILIDRRWNSSVPDAQLFRSAYCDTDHYLVVVKFRERLAKNKQRVQRIHRERFNFKQLTEVKGKSSIVLRSQIGSQLSRTQMLRWILIELQKLLE